MSTFLGLMLLLLAAITDIPQVPGPRYRYTKLHHVS